MPRHKEVIYDIEDLDQLKRVLLSKKKAVFDGLGKFYLQRYKEKGKVKYEVMFKGESDLKDALWDIHYNKKDHKKEKYPDLTNQLIELKTIVFPGFGRLYIYLQNEYKKWHDFHGWVNVPTKPFLRFLTDWEFDRSLETKGLKIERWNNPRISDPMRTTKEPAYEPK